MLVKKPFLFRYDQSGWIEDLPPMQQNRNWHGCASYKTDSGKKKKFHPAHLLSNNIGNKAYPQN